MKRRPKRVTWQDVANDWYQVACDWRAAYERQLTLCKELERKLAEKREPS
jgi:hypothetical protein